MVTGSFREGAADTPEIPIPEDHPSTLLLNLNIGPLKFNQLPKTRCFAQLYELAVLCDKYDMVKPLYDKYATPHRANAGIFGFENLRGLSEKKTLP
jgi:hypothetical protein